MPHRTCTGARSHDKTLYRDGGHALISVPVVRVRRIGAACSWGRAIIVASCAMPAMSKQVQQRTRQQDQERKQLGQMGVVAIEHVRDRSSQTEPKDPLVDP